VPPPPTPEAFGDALAAILGDAGRLATLRDGARRVAGEMPVAAHLDRLESIFAAVHD
jgi:hypothetical protein